MKKLSHEEMMENLNKFYSLIDKYITGDRKSKLKALYESISSTLVMSPASNKLDSYNCFAGGYIDHVIAVTESALIVEKVWDKFGQKKNYTTEELVFSAINHDLGKLGTNSEPYYIPNDSQWHVEKQGILYKYNGNMTHMKISERSLFYLQKAGIPITENEFISIKTNAGLYDECNRDYLVSNNPEYRLKSTLPHIIHQAKLMTTQIQNK